MTLCISVYDLIKSAFYALTALLFFSGFKKKKGRQKGYYASEVL